MRIKMVVRVVMAVVLLAGLMMNQGCSVVRASNQPSKRDLTVLEQGTRKELVRAEIGPAISTEKLSDKECDVFNFPMGSGIGAKIGRIVVYSLFDIATLGIAEVITYPIETALGNDKLMYKVCYNPEGKLVVAEQLSKQKSALSVRAGGISAPAGRASMLQYLGYSMRRGK